MMPKGFVLHAAVTWLLAGCGSPQSSPPVTAHAGSAEQTQAPTAVAPPASAPSASAPLASASPPSASPPAASAFSAPAASTPSASSSMLTCGKGEFQLSGPLDGEPAKGSYASPVYTFMNGNAEIDMALADGKHKHVPARPGTLDITFATKGQFHLKWSNTVDDGDSVPATGSVTLPAEGPHPGQTYCIKAATMTARTAADGNGVSFAITSLAKGGCKAKAAPATLRGCARP